MIKTIYQVIKYKYIFKFMNKLSSLILNINHYKSGSFRFDLIRFIYKITPNFPQGRNLRWDFILKYLPPLRMVYFSGLPVLEVGCTDSLLLCKLAQHGYQANGLDIRDYNCKLPPEIGFYKENITGELSNELKRRTFEYIICVSVLENLGTGKYDNIVNKEAQQKAIENIHSLLAPTGFFILSVPLWNWKSKEGRAYLLGDIQSMIKNYFIIFEMTVCCGHIVMALIKQEIASDGTKTIYTIG